MRTAPIRSGFRFLQVNHGYPSIMGVVVRVDTLKEEGIYRWISKFVSQPPKTQFPLLD